VEKEEVGAMRSTRKRKLIHCRAKDLPDQLPRAGMLDAFRDRSSPPRVLRIS
jgi:hypothetical protein